MFAAMNLDEPPVKALATLICSLSWNIRLRDLVEQASHIRNNVLTEPFCSKSVVLEQVLPQTDEAGVEKDFKSLNGTALLLRFEVAS